MWPLTLRAAVRRLVVCRVNKTYAFQVALSEETFFMFAETEKDKDEWIGAIGKAIVKTSMAYNQDDDDDESDDESDDEK